MIRTMYQFGLHLQNIEEMASYFEPAAEPYPSNKEDHVVLIAEVVNRKFSGLTIEAYKTALVPKYLFRELASSNSTSLVPTLHLYRDDDKVNPKTGKVKLEESCEKFLNKLKRCLDANPGLYSQSVDSTEFLESLKSGFVNFVKTNLPEKKNYLFTIKIDGQWLGEIPVIRDYFESRSYDKYFQDSKGEPYIGQDKTCAVTYRQHIPEVWGRVDTLGFTVNDISFSRNGFVARDSYKMFPASPEAVKILEGTMRALDKKMSFNFAGLKFIVLPHFVILSDDLVRQKNLVRKFANKVKDSGEPGFDPLLQSIFNSESVFHNIINDPELGKNSVYYDIFFYEEKQAQFAIKLHVSDVLPSRFGVIREAKKNITEFYQPITQKQFKKGQDLSYFYFTPSFIHIKDFFSIKREKETVVEPYFFKIVEAVFYKNKVNEEMILTAFMKKIVPAFKNAANNSYIFSDCVKYSLCIHQFFQKLQLFGNMEPTIEGPISLSALEFVKQHELFFKNHIQKAAFLLGCAVEVLLGSQRSHLNGNEPFAKRLNNLSIDYRELQRIKTELLSKVKQYADAKKLYDGEYIHRLLLEFDKLMLGGDDSNLSKTQVSYAFSVGLVLEKEFTKLRIEEYKAQKEAKKKSQRSEDQEQ